MKTVREVCAFIAQHLPEDAQCVETGSMYTCPPGNEVHNTTNNIINLVCTGQNARLFSFDIDPEHIEFARNFCKSDRAVFVEGDSVERLHWFFSGEGVRDMEINLLCLDSKEFDEDHMVNEFNEVMDHLADQHYVLADDIHNPNSVKYKKMVPLLKELGYDFVEIPTPTGLFFAAKGLPVPKV